MKQNTIKNYISLILLVFMTILIVFALRNWYRNYKAYHIKSSGINTLLTEINLNELSPYLKENDDTFIYICNNTDLACQSFEKQFKSIIVKYNLNNNMIYLNATDDSFIDKFNASYTNKIKLKYYPAIVRISDGKVTDITSRTSKENLSKEDVLKYLELNGLDSNSK